MNLLNIPTHFVKNQNYNSGEPNLSGLSLVAQSGLAFMTIRPYPNWTAGLENILFSHTHYTLATIFPYYPHDSYNWSGKSFAFVQCNRTISSHQGS